MLTRIALGLVGAGVAGWAIGRALASREKAQDETQPGEAITLTPVAYETQEVARWLAYENQQRQAIRTLRKEGTLTRGAAAVIVDALLADRKVPVSYTEAATILSTQRPELTERIRRLSREDRRTEAISLLREQTGVGLRAGTQVVDALWR